MELLDQKLLPADLNLVKDSLMHLALEESLDPKKIEVNYELVDQLIGRLEYDNPRWKNLPDMEDIWTSVAIEHMRTTVKNQLRHSGAPLKKRMDAHKDSVTISEEIPAEYETQIGSKSNQKSK